VLKVSFYCKIRKKDNPTAQIHTDSSNVIADLWVKMHLRYDLCYFTPSGLHADSELSTSWDFNVEATPIYAGWCRSRVEKLLQWSKEKKQGILVV